MPFLVLTELRKCFGEVAAVERLDLEVERGEFVVLVGPSGCGKTTALRMIAGLEIPDGGTVRLDDRDITLASPRDRDVAMVFQNYALYPHMSVAKNLGFGLRMRGLPRREVEERVQSVAATLEIDQLLDRYPAQLSGGQRQRVALGRAIVREPKLFLMDEPLSNLDAELRVSTRAELKRLHARLGVTTLYVTHDQIEAMTLGDRLVVMNGGRVEQVGTPREVYERPRSVFVARFLGSPAMNLLEGTLGWSGESGASVRVGAGAFPVDVSDALADSIRRAPRSVRLGLRPEAVSIAPSATQGSLSGTIDLVEHLGKEQVVFVRLDSVEGKDGVVQAVVPAGSAWTAGAAVHVDFTSHALHLFDGSSGERLA